LSNLARDWANPLKNTGGVDWIGDDKYNVRVVYLGDSGWQELPREIQNVNSVTSTIWFPLQETIPQGSNSDYYLYYGNPWAEAPPSDISAVFGTSSMLVAHLNGETMGSEGEEGVIGGSGFSWVEEESGYTTAFITGTATLSYTHSNNIDSHQGSVAFHIDPPWAEPWKPDDGFTHYLFEAWDSAQDHLSLYKGDDAKLHFEVVAGGQASEVTGYTNAMDYRWNTLVATWEDDGGEANLYLNGEGFTSTEVTGTLDADLDLWLGSQAGGGDAGEAAFANLMIYDEPMSEEQALSQYRALIWTDIQTQEGEWTTEPITITYDYDDLYRLTSASYSNGAVYTYTYDAVGNRQAMVSPEGSVSYTYDAANRLTNVGGVEYSWDDNGNLLYDGVRSYEYDHANQLTQITGTLTTQYAYNGDGARISKTVDGVTTDYVVDLASSLPVVISDTNAIYLYGLDIIAQQEALLQGSGQAQRY
jgi:YD repeat-containing protein